MPLLFSISLSISFHFSSLIFTMWRIEPSCVHSASTSTLSKYKVPAEASALSSPSAQSRPPFGSDATSLFLFLPLFLPAPFPAFTCPSKSSLALSSPPLFAYSFRLKRRGEVERSSLDITLVPSPTYNWTFFIPYFDMSDLHVSSRCTLLSTPTASPFSPISSAMRASFPPGAQQRSSTFSPSCRSSAHTAAADATSMPATLPVLKPRIELASTSQLHATNDGAHGTLLPSLPCFHCAFTSSLSSRMRK
mmetsp:Transcript_1483/g.2927  ORF Transcript_1483/g.2927 Transcript_1483/m.2927 type:complete len:249 (+) Transcript_1483:335-1081(+)